MNNIIEQYAEDMMGNEILISMKILKIEENVFDSDALMLSFQKEWSDYIKKLERRIEKLNKCTPHSRYFSDELGVQFF